MKVMRKYLRVALCFMAFALCSFLLVFSPTLTAYANLEYAISNYDVAINAIKMPTKTVDVSNNDKFTIPLLKNEGYNSKFEKFTVRVTDPSGTNHNYVVGGTNDETYFNDANASAAEPSIEVKALNEGKYKIVYIVEDTETGRKYYSNTYEVTVKNVSYELDFTDANGKINLLPKNIGVNQKIELPIANAKVIDGDGTLYPVIPVVTQDGAPLELNNSDFTKEGDKYYLTTDCTNEENEGAYTSVYTVEYTYGEGSNRPSKTFTINVSNKFVKPAQSEIKLITTPTMPSVQLGQKDITLPSLRLKDGLTTDIDYNLKSIKIVNENDSTIYQELTNNDYTFDMTYEAFNGVDNYADMVGNYRVIYTIEDVYGNTVTEVFTIKGVNITKKPNIYLSYDYEVDAQTGALVTNHEDIVKDASADLKVNYGYSEVKVPAIYAYDQVSDYEDLILVRYLVNANSKTIYYVDNMRYDEATKTLVSVQEGETGYNYAADANAGVNKAVSFKFANSDEASYAGTYNLEYRVISKQVKERESYLYVSGNTEYSITVLKEATASALDAAKVEITNISNGSYIDIADELIVKMTASHETDSRLQNAVFYYYGDVKSTIATDFESAIKAVQDDGNYKNEKAVLFNDDLLTELSSYTGIGRATVDGSNYAINFKNPTGTKVTVVAVSLNDSGVVGVATKTLNMKNTADDSIAPTFTISTIDESDLFDAAKENVLEMEKFNQAVEVKLPTVAFSDLGDKYLQLSVMYYVQPKDKTLDKVTYKFPIGQVYNNNTISGAKIVTNEIGIYYVAYTAMDDAGNTSVVYFTFEVVDSSKPILTVDASGDDITQSGNVVTAEVGAKIAFKADLYSSDRSTDYTEIGADIQLTKVDFDGNVCNYQPSGDDKFSYIFNGVGTYTFTFQGTYDGRTSEEKTIVVNIENPKVEWTSSFDNIPEYANMDSEVYLPDIAATADAEVTVTVTAPSGSKIEVEKVTNGSKTEWMFKTLKDSKGTYVVKYNAVSQYGSAEEKTFNIKVGDNVAPVITMSHEGELAQDIVYDGTNNIEYSININKTKKTFEVVAKSNGTIIYSYNIDMKIRENDDKGSLNTNYAWTNLKYSLVTSDGSLAEGDETGSYIISGTGTYTLKLEISDNFDNAATPKEISFKVVAENQPEEKNDTVVGAVLIVISLVVLAGIILFFTLTGKKSGGTKSKKVKSSKKTEKVENKAEVVVEEATETEAEDVVEVEEKNEVIEETQETESEAQHEETSAEEKVEETTENAEESAESTEDSTNE